MRPIQHVRCAQCHVYSISLVGGHTEQEVARLIEVYHQYHSSVSGSSVLCSFRCLECGEIGAPTLPKFRCALCAGVVVATGGSVQRDEVAGVRPDPGFARRLEGDVDLDVLRETLRMNGLPQEQRIQCWKLLLGYHSPDRRMREMELAVFQKKYAYWVMRYCQPNSQLTETQESTRQQISVDVPRTHCKTHPMFFDDERLAAALSRVLLVTSIVFLEREGYFQGLGDVAMVLFVLFCEERFPESENELARIEADVTNCLYLLLEPVLRATRGKFNHAVEFTHMEQTVAAAADPLLSAKFAELDVDWMFFAFRFNVCFMARELSLPLVAMLWDFYLVESSRGFAEFHPFVVVALLRRFRQQLMAAEDSTALLLLVQSLPVSEWGAAELRELVKDAARLRVDFGHLIELRLDKDEPSPSNLLCRKPLLEEFVVL